MSRWRNIRANSSLLLLLSMVLLLAGCRPRGVLSSREMRKVLVDLHRADAVLQVAGYNYGHDEDLAKYYQEVLNQHGITQAQFDSSLVWYTNNPQRFDKIYPRVVKDLEASRAAWQAEGNNAPEMPLEDRLVPSISYEQRVWELQHGLALHYLLGAERDTIWQADTTALLGPIGLPTDTIIAAESDSLLSMPDKRMKMIRR